MDVSTITDLNQLKALAYDQLVVIEQANKNLSLVNNRITEIASQPTGPAPQAAIETEYQFDDGLKTGSEESSSSKT